MLSVLRAAWPVVAHRSRAHWLMVAAAALVALAATTLLASTAVYGDAVARAGLRTSLEEAPRAALAIRLTTRLAPDELAEVQPTVDASLEEALWPIPGSPSRLLRAESFAMPGQHRARIRELAAIVASDEFPVKAQLEDGRWPSEAPAPGFVEAALWAPAARTLDLAVGDELELSSQTHEEHTITLRLVGLYIPQVAEDPYWRGQPLDPDGVEEGSFRTWGPFAVSEAALLESVATGRIGVTWVSEPAIDRIETDALPELRARASAADDRLRGRLAERHFALTTELPEILPRMERSLLVTRSAILVVTLQLAVLAAYALVHVAGLLVDVRRLETALLRARGAGTEQVAAMGLMEALILVVPAVLLAPSLAAVLVEALGRAGPLATSGLSLEPRVHDGASTIAALAGVGCLVAMVAPTLLAGRSLMAARAAHGRPGLLPIAQRLGLDLALAILAVIGIWQLRHYGAPLTQPLRETLGVDPLLVASPALGLLAGAVVALRLVRLLATGTERLQSRARGLVGPLGARQLARRPLRYTRSALMLMLAAALGLFAAAYAETWLQSQRDQGDHRVGADVRYDAPSRPRIPGWILAGSLLTLPGVERAMPVVREAFDVGRARGAGELLAIDPEVAGDLIRFRADLANEPLPALLDRLAGSQPEVAFVGVPDDAVRLALVLDARLSAQQPDSRQAVGRGYRGIRLTALVRDASRALHAIDAGRLSIDGGLQRAVIELEEGGRGGTRLAPARPLAIGAVQLAVEIPPGSLGSGTLRLVGVRWAPAEDPDGWRPLRLPAGGDGWIALSGDTFNPPRPLGRRNLLVAPSDGTVLLGDTGYSTSFIVGPAGLAEAADVPISVIVNERFLALTSTHVGDELEIGALADRRRVVIAGAVRGFPTVDPDAGLAIADVRILALHELAGEGRLPFVDEWWLGASDESAPAVARALEAPPFDADATASAVGTARQLANDPVALGLSGALVLGALAAVLFAVVAFVLGAAVSAGERLTEFALLRALGLSPVQLSGWLSLESAFLLLLGVGAGAGIGLLVAWVVLPLVTLTPEGTAAVPEPALVVPWPALVGLAALAAGAMLATVLVLGAVLRRLALAAALRGAEE